MTSSTRFEVWSLDDIPEIRPGDDLGEILATAAGSDLSDGDIVVVSSKIVSKAEGRQVAAADREDAITSETVRVVATRARPGGVTRIVENKLGLVQAAAGVDASNVPEGFVLLLPVNPDASAALLRAALRERLGVLVGVVVTDTLGRPWRVGQVDAAIGASGIRVVDDLRGTLDAQGRALDVTLPAVADELASAADLVKGKAASRPVAVVRGLAHLLSDDAPGARSLVRLGDEDMFRTGSDEAYDEGYRAGFDAGLAEGTPDES